MQRIAILIVILLAGCDSGSPEPISKHRLITLDPGHFHAALVQKSMYPNVDKVVSVYGPEGDDLDMHMRRIDAFNSRLESPTTWDSTVYASDDFLQKMLAEKPGDIVIISGNNSRKTDYILESLQAGLNVYADKPMVTNEAQFQQLQTAVDLARSNGLLLLDIMTERFEISTILQKEISQLPVIYGEQLNGSPDNPAITKESVHHFFKYVAGNVLQRPSWFFDDQQAGDGLVDVMTHLVDLIQWECFPDQPIDYRNDIEVDSAFRWATELSLKEFESVTRVEELPDYLQGNFHDDRLHVFSNGEINYRIRGIHARAKVGWQYRAPEGAGDTHYSEMRGSLSKLIIRQGEAEGYIPELYIEPSDTAALDTETLMAALQPLLSRYPGLSIAATQNGWRLIIPDEYRTGHEAHFAEVTQTYLKYLSEGSLPEWEMPNILAKYYVTTTALKRAQTR